MIILSELLNTHHSNPYVSREKIKNSQTLLREQLQRQKKGGVIQIDNQTILSSLQELKRRLIFVESKINTIEQLSFAFGS